MSERLASGAALWRLNGQGRLALVDAGRPLTAPEVFPLLAELARIDGSQGSEVVVLDRDAA